MSSFLPGQSVIFIGDHTSPDHPGYVGIVAEVLARFHPGLKLNLISAGSKGQSAAGLRSQAMMEILTSSRPDWLVIGIGLADAMREPAAIRLKLEQQRHVAQHDEAAEATFGPEYKVRANTYNATTVSDNGPQTQPQLERLAVFQQNLAAAVSELLKAGVRPVLLTLATPGPDLDFPANAVLKAYSREIRSIAEQQEIPLVDLERAFHGVYDRAANYKQRITLMEPSGELNAQGQSLVARTFLASVGLLPEPGSRRPKRQ